MPCRTLPRVISTRSKTSEATEKKRSGTTHNLRAGEMGSLTISYCCGRCKHVPKNVVVFLWKRSAPQKTATRMVGTWCAIFGKKKENDGHGCVVVRQHNEEASKSAVFMAVLQTQGVTYTTLSALTLANNVDVRKVFSGEAGRWIFAGPKAAKQTDRHPSVQTTLEPHSRPEQKDTRRNADDESSRGCAMKAELRSCEASRNRNLEAESDEGQRRIQTMEHGSSRRSAERSSATGD